MLFYRAALPLSSWTLACLSGIIRRHGAAAGSRWRKLNPGQQALLVLVYLRKGETFADLAAGFGVGVTTAWRYVNETVSLLAARAPKLRQAVRDATTNGHAYVVVDGTLIPIDRVAADRPLYSGKHRKLLRHEEFGVFAAVAEASLTGRPAVVCGTAGPGTAHLINGLLTGIPAGAAITARVLIFQG
jgi:hypothetical protein